MARGAAVGLAVDSRFQPRGQAGHTGLLSVGEVPIVRAQVLPVLRLNSGEQFPPALHLERPADIDLAHALHESFRDGVGEQQQGPGEGRSIQTAQLVQP